MLRTDALAVLRIQHRTQMAILLERMTGFDPSHIRSQLTVQRKDCVCFPAVAHKSLNFAATVEQQIRAI